MDPTFGLALALALGVAPLPRAGFARFYTPAEGFPTLYPRDLLMTDGALWVALGATGMPEGLARIDAASLTTGPLAVTRFVHLDPAAPADARPDEVRGLAVDRDGSVVVASSAGLFRWVADHFERLAAPEPVHDVERAADGALWVSIGGDDAGVTVAPLGALDTLAARARCHRPLKLLPHTADEAFLVCEGHILRAGPRGAFALELTGTPLRHEPGEGDERPPVWITAATMTPDGALFLLSQQGGLVRVAGDRIERVASDGSDEPPPKIGIGIPDQHFTDVLAEPGGTVLVANTRGVVQRWGPKAMDQVWPLNLTFGIDRDVGTDATPLASTEHGVFLHPDPHAGDAPHAVVRIGDGPAVFWTLRRPGTTYVDPGVLAALPDGQGGLFISTNDGLWHLLP